MKFRRHNEENCAYCESQQSSFLDITDHEANKRMKEQIEQIEQLEEENTKLREALEEIANGKPSKSIYGEGIYWWCVETAKKALEHNDE